MNAVTRFLTGGALMLVIVAPLAGCRPDPTSGDACTADTECTPDKPFCHPETHTCLECYADDQCGCHYICDPSSSTCTPLGADTKDRSNNAHGRWSGTPGEASYTFLGLCTQDADCDFGEICNPLTGGCVAAADYPASCATNTGCPAGPDGEVLACDPTKRRCLPAAVCVASYNCCGVTNFMCDPSARICRARSGTCTPPDEFTSLCPVRPKEQNTCGDGQFCSPMGDCVECVCDDDCSGGLHCYAASGECVPEGYCTSAEECNQPAESCDRRESACAPRCDNDDDCDMYHYCQPMDKVCRPRSELPCVADALDAAGNDTPEEALASGSALPVPDVGATAELADMSLCVGDEDWYTLPLTRGDKITLEGFSITTLTGKTFAYGPDGVTAIAQGTMGRRGTPQAPLVFTASYTDLYFIKVERDSSIGGPYLLSVTRTIDPTPCEDPAEAQATNQTPATASPIWPVPPAACSTLGDTTTCDGVFRMCPGDVDYYRLALAAGDALKVSLSKSSSPLELRLFGPFASPEDLDADPAHLLASATEAPLPGKTQDVATTARALSHFLVRVSNKAALGTEYTLAVQIRPSPTCAEDLYDGADPGTDASLPGVLDAAGPNDAGAVVATWIALDSNQNPVTVTSGGGAHLTLCRADEDWFRLGQNAAGALADIPANQRLEATLVFPGTPPAGVTVAIVREDGTVISGSSDPTAVAHSATIRLTDGSAYFVRVVAPPGERDPIAYDLRLLWDKPELCGDDGLGDIGATRNDTPKQATALAAPPLTHADLASCESDNDWYKVAVPSGNRLIARIKFDPNEGELGLAAYNDSVKDIDTSPAGAPLLQGLIAASAVPEHGFARVATLADGVAYLQVYNLSHWPVAYDLELALVPIACTEYGEDNDTQASATLVTFPVPAPFTPGIDAAAIDPLTVCSSDEDWFAVYLDRGDELTATVYSNPNEGTLDLYLYAASLAGLGPELGRDEGASSADGVLSVNHKVSDTDPRGAYKIALRPAHGPFRNLYYFEALVKRACIDDNREPSSAAMPSPISEAGGLVNFAGTLCNNEDWYEIDLSSDPNPTSLSVCAKFQHERGDIDLTLYRMNGTTPEFVDESATKHDQEQIIQSLSPAKYRIKVALDPRDQVYTSYRLWIVENNLGCAQP